MFSDFDRELFRTELTIMVVQLQLKTWLTSQTRNKVQLRTTHQSFGFTKANDWTARPTQVRLFQQEVRHCKEEPFGQYQQSTSRIQGTKTCESQVFALRGVSASERDLGAGQVTQYQNHIHESMQWKHVLKPWNQEVKPSPSNRFVPQPRAARSDWPFFESVTLRLMATVHMVNAPPCIGYLVQATNKFLKPGRTCACEKKCLFLEVNFGMNHEGWWDSSAATNLEQRGQAAHAISDGGGHPATPCEIQMPWMAAHHPKAWQTPQVLGTQNLYQNSPMSAGENPSLGVFQPTLRLAQYLFSSTWAGDT